MKKFASLAFGAVALAAMLGFAQPAAARGPYVDPSPVGVSSASYQEYCRDYSYRQRHADRCIHYYSISDHRNHNDDSRNKDNRRQNHDRNGDVAPY